MIVSSTSGFSSAITSFTRDFRASVSVIALLCGLGCAQPSMAQSLPTGGTVASGNVSINATSPTSLTISQSSSTGIVNWSSFAALIAVVLYGIVDGFVVYYRIVRELERDAESLRAAAPPSPRLEPAAGGIALRF